MPTQAPRLPQNPPLVARAAVQALCTLDALGRTVNVTGWAHDALSRRKLAAQRDALQAAGRPRMARVLRGATVARASVQLVTGAVDYLVGTGKSYPGAPSIRDSWALVRRGNTPQAHAARLQRVGQQAMDDASHPARMGVYGDAVTSEIRCRTRLFAPVCSALGSAVGQLSWCLTRPFHRPSRSLREAAASGSVWGASVGAGVAALSMLLASPTLWGVQILRTGSAAVKGTATLVGLAGGVVDLGAAALWGAAVGVARWAGLSLWNACFGSVETIGADETYGVPRSAGSASSSSSSSSGSASRAGSAAYVDCKEQWDSESDSDSDGELSSEPPAAREPRAAA